MLSDYGVINVGRMGGGGLYFFVFHMEPGGEGSG